MGSRKGAYSTDLPAECPLFIAIKNGLLDGLTRLYEGDILEGHGARGIAGLTGMLHVRRVERGDAGHARFSELRPLTEAARDMLREARARDRALRAMSREEFAKETSQAIRELREDRRR